MSYSFNKDYSTLSGIAIPLNIYKNIPNSVPQQILGTTISSAQSAVYTGGIGGIYAVPDFLSADQTISDTDFFIDFGDGTIVEDDLSAFHTYKTAGNYPVTLIVTTSAGHFFRNNNQYVVNVTDPVPDKIFITKDSPMQNESESTVNFFITRFNTIETSRELSANNYKIKLSVENNNTPLQQGHDYIENKNLQYENKSFFFTSPDENFDIIDSVETSSDFIYGSVDELGSLVLTTLSSSHTLLLGTSGFASFKYFEPTFKK